MEEETKKEAVQEEVKQEEKAPEKPLDKMTAIELREIAAGIEGVTGVTAMKKEELLKIIKQARGIKDEAPVKKGAGKGVDASKMKQKIGLLKKEKKAARAAKERKKVDILRRRINRLKKMTRRAA